MTLDKEVYEMTEEQFRRVDYTPLVASMILPISEHKLIKMYGEKSSLTYSTMVALGRRKNMSSEQIKEKILKVCGYKIVNCNKEGEKKYVQGNLFADL